MGALGADNPVIAHMSALGGLTIPDLNERGGLMLHNLVSDSGHPRYVLDPPSQTFLGSISHSINWFQTQLVLTLCQIRCHSHLQDQCSTGQLGMLLLRGCPGYHMAHRVRQLILFWTRKDVAASHCVTWFETQLILTPCEIGCHSFCVIIVAVDTS